MPSKSEKQYKLMQVALHNPSKLRSAGPSPQVAKECINATPKAKRKLWSKGG